MVYDNNIWAGRMPLRIAIVTLLIFLVIGGTNALSNSGGGNWSTKRNITLTETAGVERVNEAIVINISVAESVGKVDILRYFKQTYNFNVA